MLAVLLILGDNLPAFHYFPPLLIGILLLKRGYLTVKTDHKPHSVIRPCMVNHVTGYSISTP